MVIKDKIVKIRKTQRCWGCGQRFPPGCVLNYFVSITDGDFGTSYWCPICARILNDRKTRDYLMDSDDGVAQFAIIEELHGIWLETCKTNQLFIMEKESWPKFC